MLRVLATVSVALVATSSFAANLVSDQLREQSTATQLVVLSTIVGEGCTAVDAYYMGVGEEEGFAKDMAFWSVRCSDDRSFAVTIRPDAAGSTQILECEVLKAVSNQGCFESLIQ